MKSVHFRTLVLVMMVMAMLLGGCKPASTPVPTPTEKPTEATPATQEPTPVPTEEKHGGTVIIGTSQEPGTLNPLLSSADIDDAISSLTIEGLVGIDAEGNFIPVLAKQLPTISDDGLQITYQLLEGVKFSNGDPFTCADVENTWKAVMSDLSGASTAGYKDIESIECPNDYTAVVNMYKPYSAYLRLFSFIIPRAAGDFAQLDQWAFNRAPIGTGPWVVKEWAAGDHITFVPNPYYREEGKPYLDSVIIKVLPSRDVGVQLLSTGEIHALWYMTPGDYPALDAVKAQGVTYTSLRDGSVQVLVLNLADPAVDAPASAAEHPHPILGDLRVRQAIQYGIDKQLITEVLYYGNVEPGTGILFMGQYACNEPVSEYNPDKARALLDKAGWKVGPDGIREKNGVRLSLKLQTTAGNKLREDLEQVLVEMMKDIGVEFRIENVPSDVLFASWEENGFRKHGNFDILMYTTGPLPFSPDNHLYSNYHTDRIPTQENGGAGNNFSRYSNPDVDAWIDESYSSTDEAKRKELFCKIVHQVNQDLPRIFLHEDPLVVPYRVELQNFSVSPGAAYFTFNSQEWWLKK